MFLYFRHILPNLVFLDPQVPLDFVNAIVRFSYKAKSGAIGPLTAQQIRCCSEGILTEELLQHECLSTIFIPKLYEPRHALNLFQHIFTIAPLNEDSPEATDSRQPLTAHVTEPAKKTVTAPGKAPQVGKTEYLMMCLLPDKSQSEVHDCLPSTSRVSPLLVRFSNDCAPNGSFGNTVSCLISSFKWKIAHTHQRKTECLAHNIVTLRPHNAPVKVTLVNSTSYFEIHMNVGIADDTPLKEYCSEIRSTIFAALKKVFLIMQFDDIEIEPVFLCPCDPTSAHAATIFPESAVTTKSQLVCSETELSIGKLQWSHGVWFPEWHGEKQPPNPLPTIKATDRPTLPQLINFETLRGSIKITERIGTSYSKLGPLLLRDNDGSVTQAIRDQYHHAASKINYEILQRWIQGEGRQPVQWSTLIDVLKKIELSPLAKEIADNLQ